MSVLTPEQVAQYHDDGYLLVSGLIPDNISMRAAEVLALWAEGDPHNPKKSRDEVEKTPDEVAAVVACYTPQIMEAVQLLTEADPATLQAPKRPYPLHSYPVDEEWQPWGAHIDHAIKEHGHKTFPYAFRLASMLFLSDVEEHGGGTLVWKGSHKKIRALAESDTAHYEYMWVLNQELDKADIGEYTEMTPKRGDILFYYDLCAHSGSMNVRERIRLAMNAKW
jgi:hypothetical protein